MSHVFIKSLEGAEYRIPREHVKVSAELHGLSLLSNEIPVSISGGVISNIIAWIAKYFENGDLGCLPGKSMAEFIRPNPPQWHHDFFAPLDDEMISAMIIAAEFLKIHVLHASLLMWTQGLVRHLGPLDLSKMLERTDKEVSREDIDTIIEQFFDSQTNKN